MPNTGVPCSNAAKMRNLLKFAGVPQTNETISADSGLKFTILRGTCGGDIAAEHVFFQLSIRALARQSVRWCPDGDFLHPVFSASHVQHLSDLHSKFTLRPHHVWCGSMVDIQSPTAEIRRAKKKKETTGQKYNGLPYYRGRP